MSSYDAVLHYKTSMAVFMNWHMRGAISGDDLRVVSAALASKYGLSLSSIYLERGLTCQESGVIYGNDKEGS